MAIKYIWPENSFTNSVFSQEHVLLLQFPSVLLGQTSLKGRKILLLWFSYLHADDACNNDTHNISHRAEGDSGAWEGYLIDRGNFSNSQMLDGI